MRAAYGAGPTGYGLARELMRCRPRLSTLLLRHGIRFEDGGRVDDAPPRLARHDRAGPAVGAGDPRRRPRRIDALVHRRDGPEREIVALLPGSPWQTEVGRLRCTHTE